MKSEGRKTLPRAEKAENPTVTPGACIKAARAQDKNDDANPKHRREAVWGTK